MTTGYVRKRDKKFGIDLQSPSWSPYFVQILLGSTLPNCQVFPSLLSHAARCRRRFLVQAPRGQSSSGGASSFGGKIRNSFYSSELTFFSIGMFREVEKASARDSFILWRQRWKVDNESVKTKVVKKNYLLLWACHAALGIHFSKEVHSFSLLSSVLLKYDLLEIEAMPFLSKK